MFRVFRLLRKKRLYDLFNGLRHQADVAILKRQKVADLKKSFVIKKARNIINALKSQVMASKCYKYLAMKLLNVFNKRKRSYCSHFAKKFNLIGLSN